MCYTEDKLEFNEPYDVNISKCRRKLTVYSLLTYGLNQLGRV